MTSFEKLGKLLDMIEFRDDLLVFKGQVRIEAAVTGDEEYVLEVIQLNPAGKSMLMQPGVEVVRAGEEDQ